MGCGDSGGSERKEVQEDEFVRDDQGGGAANGGPWTLAFYSGSFRELFGKIKGFPIPGLAPEGIIFLRKNSAEFQAQ